MTSPDPIQWHAPVPNNIQWWMICLTIMAGGAVLSYGVGRNFKRWEEELKLPNWFSVLGELVGVLLATLGGTLAGYLTWHWGLGCLAGHVGGWASPWFMTWINRILTKRIESQDDKPEHID